MIEKRRSVGLSVLLLIPSAVLAAVFGVSLRGAASEDQSNIQRLVREYLVTFEFSQTNSTKDQVTILFSNGYLSGRAPKPIFSDDIIQEFSFSGRDFPSGPVRFNRRVRDRSFLDARYVRVVNTGTNRWFPSTISLWVDGEQVLPGVSMYPRKGRDPKGGIERWNSDEWSLATFWEGELQRIRTKK